MIVQRRRRPHLRRAGVLAVVLLVLAACTPGSAHPQADGDWVLVSGHVPAGPIEIVAGYEPTLTVHGREVSGHAGCNQFGTAEGDDPDDGDGGGDDGAWPTEFFSTMMACDPPEVMAQEALFLEGLSHITDVRTDAEELVLTGPDTELRFAPASG